MWLRRNSRARAFSRATTPPCNQLDDPRRRSSRPGHVQVDAVLLARERPFADVTLARDRLHGDLEHAVPTDAEVADVQQGQSAYGQHGVLGTTPGHAERTAL